MKAGIVAHEPRFSSSFLNRFAVAQAQASTISPGTFGITITLNAEAGAAVRRLPCEALLRLGQASDRPVSA